MMLNATSAADELKAFNAALRRDPASWRGWGALVVACPDLKNHARGTRLFEDITAILQQAIGRSDGVLLALDRHAVVAILKHPAVGLLAAAEQQLACLLHLAGISPALLRHSDCLAEAPDILEGVGTLTATVVTTERYRQRRLITPNLMRRKILLVDDDPITRWIVRTIVRDCSDLLTAADGESALQAYMRFKPDLVLLDIGLPDMTGHDVLHRLLHKDPGAYVIMFSGQDNPWHLIHSLDHGARGFIAKPFHPDTLLHYVASTPQA